MKIYNDIFNYKLNRNLIHADFVGGTRRCIMDNGQLTWNTVITESALQLERLMDCSQIANRDRLRRQKEQRLDIIRYVRKMINIFNGKYQK